MIGALLLLAAGIPVIESKRRATDADRLTASGIILSCPFKLADMDANLVVLLNGKLPSGKHDSLQVISGSTSGIANLTFVGENMSRDEKLAVGSQVFSLGHNITFNVGKQIFRAELAYDYYQDSFRPRDIYEATRMKRVKLRIYRRNDADFSYGLLTVRRGKETPAAMADCSAEPVANGLSEPSK
jgi:hypothetical protein